MKIKYAEVNNPIALSNLIAGDVFTHGQYAYILLDKEVNSIRTLCFFNLEVINLDADIKVIYKPKAILLVDGE